MVHKTAVTAPDKMVASPSFLILFSLQYAICWVTNVLKIFQTFHPIQTVQASHGFRQRMTFKIHIDTRTIKLFFSPMALNPFFFYMARSSVDDIPGKGVLSLHQPITPSALVSGRHYQHICCKMISCNGATRRRDGCGFTGLGRFWSTHCRPSNNFHIWAAVKKKG